MPLDEPVWSSAPMGPRRGGSPWESLSAAEITWPDGGSGGGDPGGGSTWADQSQTWAETTSTWADLN